MLMITQYNRAYGDLILLNISVMQGKGSWVGRNFGILFSEHYLSVIRHYIIKVLTYQSVP